MTLPTFTLTRLPYGGWLVHRYAGGDIFAGNTIEDVVNFLKKYVADEEMDDDD